MVELVEWLRRVLMVREVRGSIPYSGHFRVDHFRNVQHNTKVPISYTDSERKIQQMRRICLLKPDRQDVAVTVAVAAC